MDAESETLIPITGAAFDVANTLLGKHNSSHAADQDTYIAHSLRGEGFDASEDGTGRGTPLVPAIAFDCKSSGQNGFGIGIEVAGTQRAMAHSGSHSNGGGHQAVAVFQGEMNGWMDGRTPQGSNDLPARSVRNVRRNEYRGAPQERRLEGSSAGEFAEAVQKLPHESAQIRQAMPVMREASQGPRVLRHALSALEEVGKPGIGQSEPVQPTTQRRRARPQEDLHDSRLRENDACEGVLQPTRAAGSAGDLGTTTTDQKRIGSHALAQVWAVRRLTPEECEALQAFPRGYTRIPWRNKPADQCPDGPRYKALGNSWCTAVARWIGDRIEQVESLEVA